MTADFLSYGLAVGSALTQQHQVVTRRPAAYCSRSLSMAEQHYPQIEKEVLAST